MGRKRQASNFEMLVEVFTSLPGWVCFPAAVVVYIVITLLWGKLVGSSKAIVGLAGYGQVVAGFFAVMILAAGGVAQLAKLRRKQIYERQTGLASITKLPWREFETLVGEAYRREGYEVQETGGGGADGGIDLILRRGGEKTVVQCKQWKVLKVGVKPIRELYGVMVAEHAQKAVFVTSGVYTEEARRFAAGKPLELVDGEKLVALMSLTKETQTPAPLVAPQPPACPQCGTAMALRTARRGNNAGKQFWGCSAYPKCKGIREA